VAILGVAAWYAGYSSGIEAGMRDSFYCQSLHIRQEISALQRMQSGDLEKSRSNLETAVNFGIAQLTPTAMQSLMSDETKAYVTDSLRQVKAYRKANPWPGYEENLRKRLQEALDKIPDADTR